MKNLLALSFFFLVSLASYAQTEIGKSDTLSATQTTRVRLGANSAGRVGQRASTGLFSPFALLSEVIAATSGGITSVNGKTGPSPVLNTSDLAEVTNQFFTVARARAALSGTAPVTVNTSTGAIGFSGTKSDVGLSNVDNTSDVSKPVSTAQQTALNLKADATAVVPYISVATYSALSGVTAPGVGFFKFVEVKTDAQYTETSSLYLINSAGKIRKILLNPAEN